MLSIAGLVHILPRMVTARSPRPARSLHAYTNGAGLSSPVPQSGGPEGRGHGPGTGRSEVPEDLPWRLHRCWSQADRAGAGSCGVDDLSDRIRQPHHGCKDLGRRRTGGSAGALVRGTGRGTQPTPRHHTASDTGTAGSPHPQWCPAVVAGTLLLRTVHPGWGLSISWCWETRWSDPRSFPPRS